MDWEAIKDGSSWIAKKVNEAIWGWVYDLLSVFATETFKLLTNFIVIETDISSFLNVDHYLKYIQIIAGSLLLVKVAWVGFKQQTGPSVFNDNEVSIGALIQKTLISGMLVFFLPWSLVTFFIPLNNLGLQLISSIGIKVKPGTGTALDILLMPSMLNQVIVLMTLVFIFAAFILGIMAGIRYVEIIVLYLIAPFVATSFVDNGEALEVWFREALAIVFTQCVHMILLQMLLGVVGKLHDPVIGYSVGIGIIVVMIRGPQTLRTFIYNTGAGSSTVKAVGTGGRMAAMKFMSQATKVAA
jgi:hypothetical protein